MYVIGVSHTSIFMPIIIIYIAKGEIKTTLIPDLVLVFDPASVFEIRAEKKLWETHHRFPRERKKLPRMSPIISTLSASFAIFGSSILGGGSSLYYMHQIYFSWFVTAHFHMTYSEGVEASREAKEKEKEKRIRKSRMAGKRDGIMPSM
jgi:hypothetical protein